MKKDIFNGITEIINRKKYHPIITKKGKNWFRVMLIEDGFTFEDSLIETVFSLQGLGCIYDENKFLMENSEEVSLNDFLQTLRKDKNWLVQSYESNENKIFFTGDKRFSCKLEEKESLHKIIQEIRRNAEKEGRPKYIIEQIITQIIGEKE